MDLHDIREDYCKQALSQHDCDPNPIKQFEKWLNEAITAKVNEPTGVNVATVNEDGRPTSRMVLLKEVNEQGFVFFTKRESPTMMMIHARMVTMVIPLMVSSPSNSVMDGTLTTATKLLASAPKIRSARF